MLSKVTPRRFSRPAAAGWRSDNAGLGLYLFVCLALLGWFVFEFYQIMQPSRYPNPGVSALALPSTSGTGDVRELQIRDVQKSQIRNEAESGTATEVPSAIEPDMKTIGEAVPQPDMTQKIDPSTAPAGSKHKRAEQPREHDPTMAYSAQPFVGNYRSWSSSRSSGSYQIPSGPQSRR
jgi:hypothetical protein